MKTDALILYRFPKDGLAYRLTKLMEKANSKEEIFSEREEFFLCLNHLVEISSAHGFYGNLWHCYLTYLLVSKENAYSLGCEIKGDDGGRVSHIALEDFKIFRELFSFDFTLFEKAFDSDFSCITQFEDKNSDGRVFNHRIRDCIRNHILRGHLLSWKITLQVHPLCLPYRWSMVDARRIHRHEDRHPCECKDDTGRF